MKHFCVKSFCKGSCISLTYKHNKCVPNDHFTLKFRKIFNSGLVSPVRFTSLADFPKCVRRFFETSQEHLSLCGNPTEYTKYSTQRDKGICSCIWHQLKHYIQSRFSLGTVSNRLFQTEKLCLEMFFEVTFKIKQTDKKVFYRFSEFSTLQPITFQICHLRYFM